jgi:hypothetical protein
MSGLLNFSGECLLGGCSQCGISVYQAFVNSSLVIDCLIFGMQLDVSAFVLLCVCFKVPSA